MNTEQQLRERAAAILKPLATSAIAYEEEGLMIYFNDAANAMIDFHKQELQRIGEVYQVVSVEDELPKKQGRYFVIQPNGKLRTCIYYGGIKEFTTSVTHWLKKLSLLEGKYLGAEASNSD